MEMDRREEFNRKTEELKAQKQNLESKGQELKDKTSTPAEPTVNSTEGDRRAEFNEKTNELLAVQNTLEEQKQEISNKKAGFDNGSQQMEEPRKVVTKDTLNEFTKKLNEYKEAKSNLENRIKNNQDWWKLRHYGTMSTKSGTPAAGDKTQKDDGLPRSVTAWAVNSIINKHADYMDNYPEPICLAQEESDEETAEILSTVLPALYEKINHEQTYNDSMWNKLIAGTCVRSHTWNPNLNNGLGDIDIKDCDILNLFWEPGIKNVNDSEYFFHTQCLSNTKIKNMFPDIEGLSTNLSTPSPTITEYNYDDTIPTTDHSIVIDVYYRRANSQGKPVLHYCKYVNDTILFASENENDYAEKGYYEHNKYPYVFDTLFPVEGSLCGFGYMDIVKQVQRDIDELNDDFMRNAKNASKVRYALSDSAGVNEEELTNTNNDVIHCAGGDLGESSFRVISTEPLPSVYVTLLQNRIDEIKEVSNNRDVSSGGTSAGVTAASAIAAMQEAGTKTSRDQQASSYRAFREECYLDIELMAQFYDTDRYFRIVGNDGQAKYVAFNNQNLVAQNYEKFDKIYQRKPVFDIKIKAQKRSQYSIIAQNELMKELYAAGAFNPQNVTQATMLVTHMEFEGKETLLSEITKNGTLYDMLMKYQQLVLQMAMQLDQLTGGVNSYTQNVQMAIQQGQIPMIQMNVNSLPSSSSKADGTNTIVENAKEAARARSEVRT